eukprot:TRINITY_DN2886_c0_g1_i2.p1 TRINITY_DN2886_c0_g1~~TRINITY_DN2886_c0_g1_i2.p1  ORF type:complete len:332 (-),score=70.53 TRINITY_DN2886_c0_g1_i2:39-1034(-)
MFDSIPGLDYLSGSLTQDSGLYDDYNSDILFLDFGMGDSSHIYCGLETENGYGISYVNMMRHGTVYALVGGGVNPMYPANKLVLFDQQINGVVAEIQLRQPVKSCLMSNESVFPITEDRVLEYDIRTLELKNVYHTALNEYGVGDIHKNRLIIPAEKQGHIKIIDGHHVTVIKAHEHPLKLIKFSPDGSLFATASMQGTLIGLFDCYGRKQRLYRRGKSPAHIKSIAFEKNNEMIAVSSSSSTIHFFSINGERQNASSYLNWVNPFSETEERGFAKIDNVQPNSVLRFESPDTLLVMDKLEGMINRYSIEIEENGFPKTTLNGGINFLNKL